MRNRRLTANVVVIIFLASGVGSTAAPEPDTSAGPVAFHLLEATIDDIHAAFKSSQITCRCLVELYLKRIETYDKAGPRLNAVQTINSRALQEAERLDTVFTSSGLVGPLHCIPVLVKDQVETSDMPTTYGSAVFKDFVPLREATIVTKMKKAGAVILGKTTMGELGSRYSGSAFGVVPNAYAPALNSSGSSSGTGSAITANFAAVGIGADTGGSVRGPAAVASLVGLRPTVALVSRHGTLPARPSADILGPITRTVKDAAILLDVIAGYDPNDPASASADGQLPASYTAFLLKDGLRGARIGIIREPMDPLTDPASADFRKVRNVMDRAIADLKTLGADLVDPVTIPELKDLTKRAYEFPSFETEQAINSYLAEHSNAPVKTLREILLTGKVLPWRVSQLMSNLGKSKGDLGYLQVLLAKEQTRQTVLKVMVDNKLDALVYATFDHQPTLIPADV
jgi:amidase